MKNEEIPYRNVRAAFHVEYDSSTGKIYKDRTEKREMRARTLQQMEGQTMRGEVSAIEVPTVEQIKGTICRKGTSQIGMSRSECYVSHNGRLVQTSKMDSCLHKAVPIR